MTARHAVFGLAIALLAFAFWPLSPSSACSPGPPRPVFTRMRSPDSIDRFVSGELGVLQPTYPRAYLYIAWRALDAKPFSTDERKALLAYFNAIPSSSTPRPGAGQANALEVWRRVRMRVPGLAAEPPNLRYGSSPVIRMEKIGDRYIWYPNCLDDAFETAARTLEDRMARGGASSSEVRDWIQGQDQVFANCTGGPDPWGPKQAYMPASLSPGAPSWLRADRAYQTAAAAFYAGNMEQARDQFQKIAANRESPWRNLAALLAARAMIRLATVGRDTDAPDADRLMQAEKELGAIVADGGFKPVIPSARRLLAYVQLRLRPAEHVSALASALEQAPAKDSPDDRLRDFMFLVDKCQKARQLGGMTLDELRSRNEMTDWLFTFQDQTPGGLEHALHRWRSGRKTAWLIAALSKVPAAHPQAALLCEASGQIQAGSPGFLTAAFHRLRLTEQSGDSTKTREILDRLLATGPAGRPMPRSAENMFRALQLKTAASLEDFLAAAVRYPAASGYEYETAEVDQRRDRPVRPYFDADASRLLTSKFPLTLLDRVARTAALPPHLRRDVAIAAWTRAVLLGDEKAAVDLSPILAHLEPALANEIHAFASAASRSERVFAAAFLLLRAPGMRTFVPSGFGRTTWDQQEEAVTRIDNFRDNWWCRSGAPESGEQESVSDDWSHADRPNLQLPQTLLMLYPDGQTGSPWFLTPKQKKEARIQWERLCKLPAAPVHLAKLSLEFARAHPDDPRIPEALHLVVRATRYGCADNETSDYSRRAFTLLHRRYRGSVWAKKTPYWF